MTALQDKLAERARLWEQNKAMLDVANTAKRDLTAEEEGQYDARDADIDKLSNEIERLERHETRASQMSHVDRTGVSGPAEPQREERTYAKAYASFLRNGINGVDPDDAKMLRDNFSTIQNAAGVATGAAGGYLVPPEFRDQLVETQRYFGPMLQIAEVINTDTGAQLPWPTNDDTANVGAILGENTQVTEQDVVLGTANINAYMYTSKLVRASFQLLQDRPDFDGWLARKLGERLGRILNQHFTTGTGVNQPLGIVTGANVGVTGSGSFATTGGLSYANLIDLVESLDPAYGGGQGLQFMMHQTARRQLRRLTDSQNRPLWEPSLQAGTPDGVIGYPIVINNDMPTLAASSKSVLFGNIRESYLVRIVRDVQSLRLTERYADFLQVGFLAFERADGTVQNGNAIRVLQTTATA